MLPQDEILQAMQYERFYLSAPINTATAPRAQITYQYAGGSRPGDLPSSTSYDGWRQLSAAEKSGFEQQLDLLETYLNVTFDKVERSSDPDLNIASVALPGTVIGQGGYSIHYQGDTITSWDGYVAFDAGLNLASPDRIDLILHEMGHAMGLDHPFESAHPLPAAYENNLYTVMSYTANPLNGHHSDDLMLFDILALQNIWGAAEHNSGDTHYKGCTTTTVDSIWDSGGYDVFNATGRSSAVTLDLREGAFSSFDGDYDVVITFGTKIEAAYGAQGADHLIGNNIANQLRGNGDRDLLVGKAGHDLLEGGQGGDTLRGDWGNDTLLGGAGGDWLNGGIGEDVLSGNKGQDRLNGHSGNDALTGGWGADIFIFATGGGQDTVCDFKPGKDLLQLEGFGTPTEILNRASETASGLLFDFGDGDSLLLRNVTLSALGEDFLI